jgi:hypothetical protein
MNYNNMIAGKRIRSRIEHLGSKLRLCYDVARQPQSDQTSRDRAVVDVVLLYKQLRRSERSLQRLRADDLVMKTQRAAGDALSGERAAEKKVAV